MPTLLTRVCTVPAKKPDKGSGKKAERFELRVDPDWLARVERQADRRGIGVAAYIRQAASLELEKDEATDPKLKD